MTASPTNAYGTTDAEMAAAVYSDVYKEQYGIRPRWVNWEGVAADDIWAAVTALMAQDDPQAADHYDSKHEREAMDALEALLEADRAVAQAEAQEDVLWASLEARACRQNVTRACQRM